MFIRIKCSVTQTVDDAYICENLQNIERRNTVEFRVCTSCRFTLNLREDSFLHPSLSGEHETSETTRRYFIKLGKNDHVGCINIFCQTEYSRLKSYVRVGDR